MNFILQNLTRFTLSNLCAQIAQLVEQWTENPCVAGSIPALGTTCEVGTEMYRLFLCKNGSCLDMRIYNDII